MSEIRILREQLAVITARLDVLEEAETQMNAEPRVAAIVRAAAAISGFSAVDIVSVSRVQAVVTVRHAAILIARRLTQFSLPRLGRAFGDRDHTTVMHALARAEERYRAYADFRILCDRIEALARARLTASRLSEQQDTTDAAAHHPA